MIPPGSPDQNRNSSATNLKHGTRSYGKDRALCSAEILLARHMFMNKTSFKLSDLNLECTAKLLRAAGVFEGMLSSSSVSVSNKRFVPNSEFCTPLMDWIIASLCSGYKIGKDMSATRLFGSGPRGKGLPHGEMMNLAPLWARKNCNTGIAGAEG